MADLTSATAIKIERKPLDSSFLISAGYHPESQTLHLEFKDKNGNGQVMQYDNIPADTASAIIDAKDSHGKAYHASVRPFYVGKPLIPRTQEDAAPPPKAQLKSAVNAIQGRLEAWGKKK
jgi:KTSC domain-containing protein